MLACSLAACGGSNQPAVSDSDREVGAEQHPRLLAHFGGDYPGEQADYVARIGGKVARAAGLDGKCTFTLVNSDAVNAFAVPGCYIYVTRGILAIVNSEAELASVLAHEVGHITGNHGNRQQARSMWQTLGVIAISIFSDSPALTDLAGKASALLNLRYSRQNEYDADELGSKYLRQAGYDPHATVAMLEQLRRFGAFQESARNLKEGRRIPEWQLTHPLTENRIARAREQAGRSIAPPAAASAARRDYLRQIDGLLYGDDPQQGFILGQRFAHPVARIAFDTPPGFTMTNSPRAVLIEGPGGLRGEFGGGPIETGDLDAYTQTIVARYLGKTPVEVVSSRPAQVHGVETLLTEARVSAGGAAYSVFLAAYRGEPRQAYHFFLVSPQDTADRPAISRLLASFRQLTAAEAASLRARHLRAVTVGLGQDVATLASGMAADHPLETFLMLNGLDRPGVVSPGDPVKIIQFSGS